MGQLLGQGQCLLTPLHSLRGIAQAPQCIGRHGQAPHPRRLAISEHLGPLRRRVSEGDPLFDMRTGGGVVAQEEQGRPERVMRLQTGHRVGPTLCQSEELFPQLPRRRQCPPATIEPP